MQMIILTGFSVVLWHGKAVYHSSCMWSRRVRVTAIKDKYFYSPELTMEPWAPLTCSEIGIHCTEALHGCTVPCQGPRAAEYKYAVD